MKHFSFKWISIIIEVCQVHLSEAENLQANIDIEMIPYDIKKSK